MTPTREQLAFFDTFGFIKFPGAFRDEAHRIIEAFEGVWASHGGGHNEQGHDYKRRSAILPFIDQSEYLSALIDHPLIDGFASAVLGPDYNYTASDGNFYVGDTNWHSDNFAQNYVNIKVAFYLDPVTRDTGCLRVIPGSHRQGDRYADALHEVVPQSTVNHAEERWGLHGSDVPAYAIESVPGDVLIFNQAIKHGSWGGSDRRRMFTINFSERYRDEDVDQLREEIAGLAGFWAESAYGEKMLATAGPRRMTHLEQRMAHDDHLPALVAKAKAEMLEPSRGGGQFDVQSKTM